MALTKNVSVRRWTPVDLIPPQPVKGSTHIYHGMLCALDSSGLLVENAASGLVNACVARKEADNSSGSDSDITCAVETGYFVFKNSGSSALTQANVGDVCYGEDGQTVKASSSSASVAGIFIGFEGSDCVVAVGTWPLQVGLLAASNLSDVGSAATSRANLLSNRMSFTVQATDLVGADAVRYGFVCPALPAGSAGLVIDSIKAVLLGHALATGNATLTGKIAGTAITTGVLTITQAGSAIGDVVTCSPSAARTATAGQFIEFLVGGTNDNAAAFAEITVSGSY